MSPTNLRARSTRVAAVAAVAVTGAVAAVRFADAASTPPDEPPSTTADDRTYATAARRDLTREESFDGTVARPGSTSLRLHGGGTLTGLPAVGDVLSSGTVLAEVDGAPIVVLDGARPAWRTLAPGVKDGEDVRQLEQALVALGYADPNVFTPDDEWTSATTRAVKHLQFTLGLAEDGRLELGELVFTPLAPLRVAAVEASIGDPVEGVVIEVTEERQVVSASVDATDVELLAVGDEVEVELATGEVLTGRVDVVGAAEVGADGSVTVPVEIGVDGLAAVDGLPAEVRVSAVEAANVLAVPVESLLALAEGGYAVEVRDASSATGTRLVAVDPGVFADGSVQVDGDLAAGDEVVVP